jgi:hypothetical protein
LGWLEGIDPIIQAQDGVVGFFVDQANAQAQEVMEILCLGEVPQATARLSPTADIAESDKLRGQVPAIPDGIPELQVGDQHPGAPVDAVARTPDVDVAIQHERGKRRILIVRKTRPEPQGEVQALGLAQPAEVAEIHPINPKPVLVAEVINALQVLVDIPALQLVEVIIDAAQPVLKLEQKLGDARRRRARRDFAGVAGRFAVSLHKKIAPKGELVIHRKLMMAHGPYAQVVVVVKHLLAIKIERLGRGPAQATEGDAPLTPLEVRDFEVKLAPRGGRRSVGTCP